MSRSTTVVLPVPEGADTTTSSPRRSGSFDILHLLADPFELGFRVDHPLGSLGALDLGSDGVDLPIHLLHEKIELAAARLRPFSQAPPVFEMAAQPDDLLIDVRTRDEPDDFLADG